ncbi:MAG: hypothetical protein A2Y33_12260 [Spirochaetes bacterium GWF1_51_8]|nr:MAG: hypothetical protein A2Y33_12260 [Spirochaetes bacterium GWF1_51_8]
MRTLLKCDPVTVVILLILGLGGGFALGYFTAPKEINEYQYITQQQTQMQAQGQMTVTVVDGKALQSVTIQLEGMTNIRFLTVSNGVTNVASNDIMMDIKKK